MPVTACWAATLWSVDVVRNWSGTQSAEDDDEQGPQVEAAEAVKAGVELPALARSRSLLGDAHHDASPPRWRVDAAPPNSNQFDSRTDAARQPCRMKHPLLGG